MLKNGLHRHLELIWAWPDLLWLFLVLLKDLWQVCLSMNLALRTLARNRLRYATDFVVDCFFVVHGSAVISSLHSLDLALEFLGATWINWRYLGRCGDDRLTIDALSVAHAMLSSTCSVTRWLATSLHHSWWSNWAFCVVLLQAKILCSRFYLSKLRSLHYWLLNLWSSFRCLVKVNESFIYSFGVIITICFEWLMATVSNSVRWNVATWSVCRWFNATVSCIDRLPSNLRVTFEAIGYLVALHVSTTAC